jgi:hypothetical protein
MTVDDENQRITERWMQDGELRLSWRYDGQRVTALFEEQRNAWRVSLWSMHSGARLDAWPSRAMPGTAPLQDRLWAAAELTCQWPPDSYYREF